MRRLLVGAAALTMVVAGPVVAQDFPAKDLQGIIQWGAGGSTDVVMRSVTPHAEEVLGADVVMQNKTGGVGAIATKFVYAQKADGYTLLMGAENPQLYKVMGLGDIDYSSFVPIDILARGVPILVAKNDAPYGTLKELIDYAQAHPGEVKVGSTGPGGLPSVVTAMLQSQTDLPMTAVPYDGDGPALTALMGGAIDVMPAVLGAALENIKAGRIKPLAVIETEANPVLPDVPPVTDTLPDIATYLPWGPFFGVFVKEGTPPEAVEKLTAAYRAGAESDDFKKLMDERGYKLMNLSGEEARAFLDRWQSVTSWLVYDAGIAKKSPEEFGIPKP
ncbi:Bug family tripartite tricarboxylate transporter substrate binding protein [Amaricoccus solimangrovi]|uniref:Tripartite tricarboxylate transporter substrate binding protein n=1 Tax=Amaricoccus solimangrovi TaxID=2589815 RepID=A0A501WYE4_9RHOB|nr:tripartite tricarboxylate transporter substrate binding protein [Amaricoccus solimangrovi]TPE50956.1 tripartite tricarboxylate transporter substrate binding protein [Amaricoccus solimangrovi]